MTVNPLHYCPAFEALQKSRQLAVKYRAHFKKEGLPITITQFHLLAAVAQTPQANITQLWRTLKCDKGTVSRGLAILERHHWIERKIDYGKDERNTRVTLTNEGSVFYKRALAAWASLTTYGD